MGMLSSLLPKSRDFVRMTRCGLTTSFVGKKKFPCVQRLAEKVSAGDESIGLVGVDISFSQLKKIDRAKTTTALKRVRENMCRPSGTQVHFPLLPALPCRAFTCRRFAARIWQISLHCSPGNLVLTYILKPKGFLMRNASPAASSGQALKALSY